jgi:hypothetical protein
MLSEFKILAVKNKICHFSYVEINFCTGSEEQIIDSISQPVDWNNCEVGSNHEWFDAAVKGISKALKYIRKHHAAQQFEVEVIKIRGSLLDTTSDDIESSAFMATIKAYLGDSFHYEMEIVDSKWNIVILAEESSTGMN